MRYLGRVLVLLAALLVSGLPVLAVHANQGDPWLRPSGPYAGDFPDPSVLRVGSTYYAYATNTGGSYVPVLVSRDLRRWLARPAYDALPQPARWGSQVRWRRPLPKEVWAPGVFAFGGRYVAFYALRVQAAPRRTCISVATAASPLGPFVDRTRVPVVCSADPLGAIDPQPYLDPGTGAAYLTWKSEGEAGVTPTRLWAQRLDARGTGLLGGAPRALLLETALPWEGAIIENPAMIRYRGTWWLFYSANAWESPRYAVGYARCSGPLGPCARGSDRPLLSSTTTRLGPGGAAPFLDTAGRLRLAYHYWSAPASSYRTGQRRLAVATLQLDRSGRLALHH